MSILSCREGVTWTKISRIVAVLDTLTMIVSLSRDAAHFDAAQFRIAVLDIGQPFSIQIFIRTPEWMTCFTVKAFVHSLTLSANVTREQKSRYTSQSCSQILRLGITKLESHSVTSS